MKYDRLIAIRLSREQYAQLKELADGRFTTVATVVRQSIDREVRRAKE
tara:strand:+ start:424 stop:567 length:144 start_codon:yes stop_codon:yes gene_type:complete